MRSRSNTQKTILFGQALPIGSEGFSACINGEPVTLQPRSKVFKTETEKDNTKAFSMIQSP